MKWKLKYDYLNEKEFFMERYSSKLLIFHIIFFTLICLYHSNYSMIMNENDLTSRIILSSPIFILYYIGFVYFFSKEKIIITDKYLIIEKNFLFYPFKRTIEVESIKTIFYSYEKMTFYDFLCRITVNILSFWLLNSLRVGVTKERKIKEYYFGKELGREEVDILAEAYDKIVKNKNKDFRFYKN